MDRAAAMIACKMGISSLAVTFNNVWFIDYLIPEIFPISFNPIEGMSGNNRYVVECYVIDARRWFTANLSDGNRDRREDE